VVLAGLGLDEWGRKLAAGAGAAEVLELAPRLDPLPTPRGALMGAEHDEAGGALDPHVWLDPVRMQTATDLLVDACVRLDPAGADGFRSRGAEVKASLAALHRDIERRTRAFTKRSVVTFHGSWNYFAARYGLTIAAVVEPFPGQEPSPAYVRDVLRIVKDSHVAALFSEPQLGRRPAQVIAQESGVPLFELDPIGGTAGLESYEALLRHDTAVLEQALR
jgi:ABC-type Zn uptake system ZnuABC Zn-binding protein ZnuA